MRSITAVCAPLLALAFAVPHAHAAGIPSPSQSFVTRPMVACPAGDVGFTTIMRTLLNNPISNADVTVEMCSSVTIPTVMGDEGYDVAFFPNTTTPYLKKMTGVNGEADFAIRAGGACPDQGVKIYGNGQIVALRALASPDQDGNLSVGPEDVAIANAKLGTSDPTADFDGDGTVTAADLAILSAHLGHHAPGMATPVASRTWGTLKLLYR
jgi:hypothetical protein